MNIHDATETAYKNGFEAGYEAGKHVIRKGRWVHDINNLYCCSECLGRETMSHKRLKLYCPNCGADMRSKGEDR